MAVPATVAAVPASLYVGDLHSEVVDHHLFEAFAEFKTMDSVRVCRDRVTMKSLCYGYVNFKSQQDGISLSLSLFLSLRHVYIIINNIND